MVYKETILRVIDNSGVGLVKCIHIYGVGNRKYAKAGDLVLVSVFRVDRGSVIKKGKLFKAVVVRTVKESMRLGGESVKFSDNSVVLLKNDLTPVGSRILGPVSFALRNSGFLRVISLAYITI